MSRSLSYVTDFPDVAAMAEQASMIHRIAQGDRDLEEQGFEQFHRARRLDKVNLLICVGEAEVLVALDRPEEAYEPISPLIYLFPVTRSTGEP